MENFVAGKGVRLNNSKASELVEAIYKGAPPLDERDEHMSEGQESEKVIGQPTPSDKESLLRPIVEEVSSIITNVNVSPKAIVDSDVPSTPAAGRAKLPRFAPLAATTTTATEKLSNSLSKGGSAGVDIIAFDPFFGIRVQ